MYVFLIVLYIFIKCRKDFDAEREIELEKHEKCRKSVDSIHEEEDPETK